MRYSVIAAAGAALLAATTFAHAAEGFYYEKGVVESIDSETLTLQGGEVFHLPADWNSPDVSQGDEIKVYYNIRARQQQATGLEVLASS